MTDRSIHGDVSEHISEGAAPDGRQRRRLVFSPPEYAAFFHIERAGPTTLGGVVVVRRSVADGSAATAKVVAAHGRELIAAAQVSAQRLMMLDLLGLAGGPASHLIPGNAASAELLTAFAQVPAIALDVPDMATLPSMPVWDILGPHLPWLARTP